MRLIKLFKKRSWCLVSSDENRIIKNVVSGIHSAPSGGGPEADDVNLQDNVRRVAIGSDHCIRCDSGSTPETHDYIPLVIL